MKYLRFPSLEEQQKITTRQVQNSLALEETVRTIFSDVQKKGDQAVFKYSQLFDGFQGENLRVSPEEIQKAASQIAPKLKQAIDRAAQQIHTFHESQREPIQRITTSPGVTCWRESRPIETVGLYIPGGTAPLFSTVLMLGIPAQIAGCPNRILCTPPNAQGEINPAILYAAQVAGITELYKVGGIQAIAGLTFGTKSIPKVDKIFGPGNKYVTAAKSYAQQLQVAVDLPAGPSEVLIITDANSNPDFVAADLLAQAEHDADSQVIVVSDSPEQLQSIQAAIDRQLTDLPRKDIAQQALQNSYAIALPSLDDCFAFSNAFAPEHLIVALDNAADWSSKITAAGSVFLGTYSCETAGDYASGTNHTLPTSGYAKAYSGVSLDSFIKKITFQEITKEGLNDLGPTLEILAEAEGLFAHKNAVSLRIKDNNS
ncbi:histidinol dehydrogenase [Flavobacterium sp.]|jgi:histidinol dehydrogenase|uniref:histidinol dehydrogenase n=1 Tax=Flavobacterium sp. TaxID=239 RepID=UPI0022C38483|nr:histidinol dehydrogenase [Flavobacterium sp.]MCZ8145924.1 histidinol dehydrogenase [Flavobacterium sp.]MCZ8366781.1 histidinol dehydrogenase [Flavobacterium sp.]